MNWLNLLYCKQWGNSFVTKSRCLCPFMSCAVYLYRSDEMGDSWYSEQFTEFIKRI